jgi:Uncharacterised nucleotidyltransferase
MRLSTLRMPTLSLSSGAQTKQEPAAFRTSYSAEFSLLLACCRTELHPDESPAKEFLVSALANVSDWQRAFELSEHHGLLPALHQASSGLGAGSAVRAELFPREVRVEIERRFALLSRKNLRLAAELIHILDSLEACGVAAIPHKGPVLAESLYRDVALRDFSDLDVLVRGEDIPSVKAALAQIGYRPNITLSPAQEWAYVASGYEYAFDGPAGKNLLEIQWNFVPRFYAVDFAMESVLARAQPGTVAGRSVRTLAPEDLFLSMCVHGAKHLWGRLCWLRDIATVVQRVPIDWECVHREARRLGVERIVGVSLCLAQGLMGAEIPAEERERFVGDKDDLEVQTITTAVAQHISNAEDYNTESIDYVRWMLRLRERFLDRARFASRLLLTPGPGEWSWAELPEALFPLYRGVRLLRVGKRLLALRER